MREGAAAESLPWVKLRRTRGDQISSGLPLKADITQYSRHVSKVPIGGIAVELLHSPCVAQFPSADTVCQLHENCRLTAFGLRHIAIAYPCVGALRCYGLAGATCGSVNGSVRCTIPSAYNPSISACDRPSIVERMSVVSSPIDGAPRQMRPGVSDIFGTTPKTRTGTPDCRSSTGTVISRAA